ncbi:hypothetical protein EV702DRAFT_1121476 [Suillus placidus]|uniref:Uncharacterized protein n=1 Tax=Suillus placidus TaxID=48579 RepID=A0A9P7D0T4_9AGAM|nr:hypothetical protein EV702DRAFT_1121476 [Suillus placidus]
MRFSFVLAVVAALTAPVSVASMPTTGSELNSADCPVFCFSNHACADCWFGHKCVSLSGSRPVFNHTTHRRGRSSLDAIPELLGEK